jgi:hypothetical protein
VSDNFEMLVDTDVTAEKAEELSRSVMDRFRQLGLITGDAVRDCVYGGTGYRPGSAIPSLYNRREGEGRFWELRTCGVQPRVGRDFNVWALGPGQEGFTCPLCGVVFQLSGEEFEKPVGMAIIDMDESARTRLAPMPTVREGTLPNRMAERPSTRLRQPIVSLLELAALRLRRVEDRCRGRGARSDGAHDCKNLGPHLGGRFP